MGEYNNTLLPKYERKEEREERRLSQ